jgi:effector-binding domain-containing protein
MLRCPPASRAPEPPVKAETVIGPVSIVEKPARPYAGIRLETPFPGMFAVATRALKVLRSWTREAGIPAAGPYFLRYYHCDMSAIMEIEAGVMTPTTPDPNEDLMVSLSNHEDRITPGLLPAGRYASLIYRGNGLRGNQALMQWGRDTGTRFEPIDPKVSESYVCRYEAYLTDWRIEPRKLLWDVELSIKVA